jgi:hypothetical protein
MERGDALGRYSQVCMVPFARLYFKRIIELTEYVAAQVPTRENYVDWAPCTTPAEPCDETWLMVYHRYGLTREHEERYGQLLAQVQRLPAVVNYAPFLTMLNVDIHDFPWSDDSCSF